MPLQLKPKDPDTIRIWRWDLHKTSLFFIAQVVAFWLMVLGMIVFVVVWYLGQV